LRHVNLKKSIKNTHPGITPQNQTPYPCGLQGGVAGLNPNSALYEQEKKHNCFFLLQFPATRANPLTSVQGTASIAPFAEAKPPEATSNGLFAGSIKTIHT
jgi:hypothetical protein